MEENESAKGANANYKMLEIKNVTKIYKTKGGVETRALDDVSISFGQTGLVFLLGKSGSGKSTLLNVSGGLDEPTEGEIIVKGKSSKEFTGSDFDSYRNTFVGFIFQEYNILDEFNVEDNIALALELQGKPKDREKINSLLRDVELEAYAKRKPNTLSGGQKQRIAIARALIKEPQIIMADEPTGALDSVTGKQVFDTLKKLSETRLVIVVSHDREFAEIYGDRIVELKDGKIISDVTKEHIPPTAIDENVSIVGGNTLSIKKGSTLTAANVKTIQDFIKNTDGDVIITNGAREIENFKKSNRMSEGGATEKFGDTSPEALADREYTKEENKFIRSRLPAAKAIKIGASGLKLKPIRLIFTIFLSFVAFTMFGLFSTLMTYDGDEVAAKSFADSGTEYINVSKMYRTYVTAQYGDDEAYTYWDADSARFTQAELDALSATYGSSSFGYYNPRSTVSIRNVVINKTSAGQTTYYQADFSSFAYLPSSHRLRGSIIGEYPSETDEVCISSYMIETFQSPVSAFCNVTVDEHGAINAYSTSDRLTISSAQDVIGKYIALSVDGSETAFKVTGVFDSGEVAAKYDKIKNNEDADFMLTQSYDIYINSESMHKFAFVCEDFFEAYYDAFKPVNYGFDRVDYFDYSSDSFYYSDADYTFDEELGAYVLRGDQTEESNSAPALDGAHDAAPYWSSAGPERGSQLGDSVRGFGGENQLETHFFNADKSALAENEMIISYETLSYMCSTEAAVKNGLIAKVKAGEFDQFHSEFEEGTVEYNYDVMSFVEQYYRDNLDLSDLCQAYSYGYYFKYFYDDDGNFVEERQVNLTAAERKAAVEKLTGILTEYLGEFDLKTYLGRYINPGDRNMQFEDYDMKVVGFFVSDYDAYSQTGIYFNQAFIDANVEVYNEMFKETRVTKYVKSPDEKYSGIMLEYDGSADTYKQLAKSVGSDNADEHDVYYYPESSLYEMVEMANSYAEELSTIFLWVGVVFAVFAALLLFNFVSMSIANKRKEIGILRAVGARGIDVFKIFFAEAGIIVGICTLLSLVGTVAICSVLNGVLRTEIGLNISLFVFGALSVVMMVAIALVVAFIATFLPVFFAARKKPVESIRAL